MTCARWIVMRSRNAAHPKKACSNSCCTHVLELDSAATLSPAFRFFSFSFSFSASSLAVSFSLSFGVKAKGPSPEKPIVESKQRESRNCRILSDRSMRGGKGPPRPLLRWNHRHIVQNRATGGSRPRREATALLRPPSPYLQPFQRNPFEYRVLRRYQCWFAGTTNGRGNVPLTDRNGQEEVALPEN